jgi:hypothetical protein
MSGLSQIILEQVPGICSSPSGFRAATARERVEVKVFSRSLTVAALNAASGQRPDPICSLPLSEFEHGFIIY